MRSLDIHPFAGALPIEFGMARTAVAEILGVPNSSNERVDSWGPTMEINIGYDQNGFVNQIGLAPGKYAVAITGQTIWCQDDHRDPNPIFLDLDPDPLERVGFLVFTKIGVATTGYHDDDPSQRAISVYPTDAWNRLLERANKSDLIKYK